jgi:RimJ/RimL family protein N-acetyltransferase
MTSRSPAPLSYIVLARSSTERKFPPLPPLAHSYTWALWRPSVRAVHPPGPRAAHFAIWWLAHYGHLFRNRDYGVFVILHAGEVVHRSVVFPPYFTFPFMAPGDVQIGGTWTAEAHRGRKLAAVAIQRIAALNARPGRTIWYVTAAENTASLKTAESAGLERVGMAVRHAVPGIRMLGRYEITATRFAAPTAL